VTRLHRNWLAGVWLCAGCAFELPTLATHPDATDGGADANAGSSSDAAAERMAPFLGKRCDETDPVPLLCDDFDSSPLEDKWSPSQAYARETVVIDTKDYVSADKSLLFSVAPGTYQPDYFTFAIASHEIRPDPYRDVPVRVHLAADFKVEAFDARPGRTADVFAWRSSTLGFGKSSFVLQLESRGERVGARFVERESPESELPESITEHALNTELELGKWSRVSFDLTRLAEEDDGNFAKVTVNDVVMFEGRLSYPYHWYVPAMICGLHYVNTSEPTQAWRVRFDNVVLDVVRL
jgi:hypothetical protein